ncbi:ATP-dependent exoDNAse (exonuclease V) beta subunit (contains helicase and exonuclease domains) [Halogranum gelatinilyticum]|uniref:DNA 3'-5' helicase n=1 Tax=Halogranum gelatinilyticum TaxID=660521 RepID=A0A1G9Z0D3_9EURY|nr:ATP-dependent DNA helicase [Halogranum gelatinilyticum]SDN14445.1 ATP-dependent exoDNAse (exonuclease V) beta subunit (contains helicase and exonuclease domains) [Halogranum gelatinilyticum]
MTAPNDRQQDLIDSKAGIHVVDAGAGTGKTFTVTRRYAEIVDQDDVEPEDVLLVTFTNNAATEMRERIVANCDYGMRELSDAPIQTFHSLCHDILMEHGFEAPTLLGIDDRITGSTRVLEDENVERERFREFVRRFSDDHPEHDDFFRAVDEPVELLGLINQLAAKGVFPTADGWYRNGERHLDGDFEAFREIFDELNQPRNGGSKQSELRSKLGGYGNDKCYLPDAPEEDEVRGGWGEKQVPATVARLAFDEEREALKSFVHDVYHEYLAFALSRNYLNFSFLQLFTFVLLCDDHRLRDDVAFEYVMIDEFQDSSEIQFKLALLLADTNNVCVVGDWKQSIYSFQYAAVENITEFESRLDRFVDELNEDHERVSWATRPVTGIELVENYRSTQAILDFSEHSLVTPAASTDDVDEAAVRDRIVSLSSNTAHENSRIEAIRHEDEHEAVLTKIQEIVGNDAYQVEEDDELRPPEYGDVAVLTRTRDFGRELLSVADEYGLPMAYEGGIELFRSDPAKLLLAWLRILEFDGERGWAVVLEEAGYTLDEVKHVLESEAYPDNLRAFKSVLASLETVGGVAQRVFSQYGYDGAYADVLLTTVQSVHSATTLTRGDLVRFIERGIEEGSTHDVHASAGTNSVTVQTIHAAKGLEHPIVVLANMNAHRFPPSGGNSAAITFDDPIGLRQRKRYDDDHGHPHIYDSWRSDVLRKCLPRGYDEERRLLYVAMTRAESHLVFSAGENPNTFLEDLPVDVKELEPDVQDADSSETTQARLQIAVPTPDGPVGHSPHTLMRDDVFEDVDDGRGTAFGTQTHEFAERYVLEGDVDPSNDDERHVKSFIDSLDGELRVEEDASLPLTVDGERVTISGIVDLVHIRPDAVEIIDFKTDLGRHAEDEYRKQLSVYYHVLAEWFPDREVTASIFYTADGTRVEVDPLTESDLVELIAEEQGLDTSAQ